MQNWSSFASSRVTRSKHNSFPQHRAVSVLYWTFPMKLPCGERHKTSPWWRHPMRTFSALLALCEGNHRSPVDSLTKASDAELWCFLWSAPEQTVEQTIVTPMIWDAIALIMTSLQCLHFGSGNAVPWQTPASAECQRRIGDKPLNQRWRHWRRHYPGGGGGGGMS